MEGRETSVSISGKKGVFMQKQPMSNSYQETTNEIQPPDTT